MSEALNFTTKAIADLACCEAPDAPLTRAGLRYLEAKLCRAQVFVLPDHGELLDRDKVAPEIEGLMLKPPFDVVALEYTSASSMRSNGQPRRDDDVYTAARCSRRIALAWEWADDLPPAWKGVSLQPGVVIASIAFYDAQRAWVPVIGAIHYPYEAEWSTPTAGVSRFRDAMIANGQLPKAKVNARSRLGSPIPLMPEVFCAVEQSLGSVEAAHDMMLADLTDESSAYLDFCCALACRNVSFERHPASERLNKSRIASGKLPLLDHHTLVIGDEALGGPGAASPHGSPRSHLRRGHIRRLGPSRVTWVNQTMVAGRGGFLDKTYRMKGVAQ